jgi:hypothetical protein
MSTPENPDLFIRLWCFHCEKCFHISGSAPLNLIRCPHEKQEDKKHNWDFDMIHKYSERTR